MKLLSLACVPGAVAVVVTAYVYGDGSLAVLGHGASAIIVLGGTAAATFIGHPLRDVARAVRASVRSFVEDAPDLESVTAKLMDWSLRAHRQGVLALDAELDAIDEPYLRQALALVVGGVDVAPLRDALADEIAGGRAGVATSHDDLVLSLPEAATYESGRAELNANARRVLARFSSVLVQTGLDARVEGHTDDVPISSPRFSSNWELSTARASGVVAALVAQGVDPVRLSAAGYGQFHPKVPNVTAVDRALNRRVDIVLVGGALVGGAVGPQMVPDAGSVRP